MMFAPLKGHRPVILSLAALLLVNMLPVFGVLFLGWSVFDVMVLFWLENIVIGVINLLRMGTRVVLLGEWAGLFFMTFFAFHYGAFCAGHGMFVFAMFGESAKLITADASMSPLGLVRMITAFIGAQPGFLWATIGLFASHGVSYVVNFIGRGEYRTINAGDLLYGPYTRIVVLHVTIILGAIAVTALGQPIYAVIILIGLKTAIDAFAHLKERQRFSAPATPVASSDAILDKSRP
jgi:hypothetical protein